jgi:streptomycin 3"-adenylyltransferase
MPNPSDMARSLDEYLRELSRRVSAVLRSQLVGVYLHGSAAMGAFVPSRSDVDVLVVSRDSLTTEAKKALIDSLSEPMLPCPGVGLELSVVTLRVARDPSAIAAFELHLATEESRVADAGVDPDLVAHFAMVRSRGRSLLGPPPQEVFASVDRRALLSSLADDLSWAIGEGRFGYAVLNACRSLCFAREGALVSKPEGAEWALREGVGDPDMIRAALRRQCGSDEEVNGGAASTFAARARDELLALMEGDG